MNRGKAVVDRLVTLLLAVLFGGLAFWGIGQYFDVAAAQHISEVADRDFWAGLADRESYVTILVLAAVVLGVIGLILVGINTGRRRLGRMVSPASNSLGAIRTAPTRHRLGRGTVAGEVGRRDRGVAPHHPGPGNRRDRGQGAGARRDGHDPG